MASLNPKQFFHGTTAKLEPGDVLRPGLDVGIHRHSPDLEGDDPDEPDLSRVFSTQDEGDAWAFAINASDYSLYENNREFQDRPYVYEVEPQGRVTGREELELPNARYETMSDTAVVKSRVDIPKPNSNLFHGQQTGPAVQGVIPGDEPEFGHGYMPEHEMQQMTDANEKRSMEEHGDNDWFTRAQSEVKFRQESGHPELFNGEEFRNLSYLEDKRYRNRW